MNKLPIGFGVHQGSALSALLFKLAMKDTKHCRRGDPWEFMYADDLVLTASSKPDFQKNSTTTRVKNKCF